MKPELAILPFATQKDFASWLAKHHAGPQGLWIKIAKKGTSIQSITYAEALDVCLCYGWIDGQLKGFDDTYYLQRVTPRRPQSMWSQINREHIARLAKAGKMQPSGLAAVEAAKKDGRWDAAYRQATSAAPDDFLAALSKNKKAEAFYHTLKKVNTFAIAFRIGQAKRSETRQTRIKKLIAMLEEGKTPY